jgi:CHAT domain-containing protein
MGPISPNLAVRPAHFSLRACLLISFLVVGGSAFAESAKQGRAPSRCIPEIETRLSSAVSARKYSDALGLSESFATAAKLRFGENSYCHGVSLASRAEILQLAARGTEAGPLFERALSLLRSHGEPTDPKLTLTLNNFGHYLYWLRRYAEAARVHEEALDLRRQHKPRDEGAVADSLHNLADAYRYLGRSPDSLAKLYREALDIRTRLQRPDELSIAYTRQNYASALELLGDLKGAAQNLGQALAIFRRRLPATDTQIAALVNRQAILLQLQGNNLGAEQKFGQALQLYRSNDTAQKAALAATLDDFAINQVRSGRFEKASSFLEEALSLRQSVFGHEHATIARTLSNLSHVQWLRGAYADSLKNARRASEITIANGSTDTAARLRLQRHLLSAWAVASSTGQEANPNLTEEAFAIVQLATRSDVATTVARTGIRFSASNPELRDALKKIDDLDKEIVGLEQGLAHVLTLSADVANLEFSKARARIFELRSRRQQLLDTIESSFPEYSRLIRPKPLSIAQTRSLLDSDEALIVIAHGFEEIWLWCVTREGAIWRKLDASPDEVERSVKALRKSLDIEPADGPRGANPLLFDLGLAHELYLKLLGPISTIVKAKSRLIVVRSGPLTTIPLHSLVISKPAVAKPNYQQSEIYRDADWLVRHNAIAALPSVESLATLRRKSKPREGRKPLIGFANPLPSPNFIGPPASASPTVRRGTRAASIRSGLSDAISEARPRDMTPLRQFLAREPLENSERELRKVGEIVGADQQDLFTGARASEAAVKAGKLSEYRIVYFATHGYVAGSFDQAEPSLALTVPENPSESDDGLLTASEISQLDLDADWVVLSACDTAGGIQKGADGLSGLARAFFHAGARALLVSHWSLDDQSALELTTSLFQRLSADPTASRAHALQGAMLEQINGARGGENLWSAYPGRWAAFELIGLE